MTQQQKTPPRALPICKRRHTARYIHDLRRAEAGGGHLIECACGRTAKHASFDLAWAHWLKHHAAHQIPTSEQAGGSNVIQLGLRLAGGDA